MTRLFLNLSSEFSINVGAAAIVEVVTSITVVFGINTILRGFHCGQLLRDISFILNKLFELFYLYSQNDLDVALFSALFIDLMHFRFAKNAQTMELRAQRTSLMLRLERLEPLWFRKSISNLR